MARFKSLVVHNNSVYNHGGINRWRVNAVSIILSSARKPIIPLFTWIDYVRSRRPLMSRMVIRNTSQFGAHQDENNFRTVDLLWPKPERHFKTDRFGLYGKVIVNGNYSDILQFLLVWRIKNSDKNRIFFRQLQQFCWSTQSNGC